MSRLALLVRSSLCRRCPVLPDSRKSCERRDACPGSRPYDAATPKMTASASQLKSMAEPPIGAAKGKSRTPAKA
jgi:hypothetical protein